MECIQVDQYTAHFGLSLASSSVFGILILTLQLIFKAGEWQLGHMDALGASVGD